MSALGQKQILGKATQASLTTKPTKEASAMSALGQKQTSERVQSMSALPPKADIETQSRNLRFVP
jgi:hypothetical protein